MKSKIAVILTILLLFALAGCNNTPQTEKMPEPFSFSESNEQTSESDTLPAAEETKEVEPTPEPMQSTEPAETESTAESKSTESSKPKELSRLPYRLLLHRTSHRRKQKAKHQ